MGSSLDSKWRELHLKTWVFQKTLQKRVVGVRGLVDLVADTLLHRARGTMRVEVVRPTLSQPLSYGKGSPTTDLVKKLREQLQEAPQEILLCGVRLVSCRHPGCLFQALQIRANRRRKTGHSNPKIPGVRAGRFNPS